MSSGRTKSSTGEIPIAIFSAGPGRGGGGGLDPLPVRAYVCPQHFHGFQLGLAPSLASEPIPALTISSTSAAAASASRLASAHA